MWEAACSRVASIPGLHDRAPLRHVRQRVEPPPYPAVFPVFMTGLH